MGQPDARADRCAGWNADADAGLYDCGESRRADGGSGQQRNVVDLGGRWLLVVGVIGGLEPAFRCDGWLQPDLDQRIDHIDGNVYRRFGNSSGNVLDYDYGNERKPVAFNQCEPDGELEPVELLDLGFAELADGIERIVGQHDGYALGYGDGHCHVHGLGDEQW